MKRPIAVLVVFTTGAFAAARAEQAHLPVPLPEARSNVAVAAGGEPWQLVAMYGLAEPVDHAAIRSDGWLWDVNEGGWRALPAPAHMGPGRLAASAVWLRDQPWLIGGYTVAADGAERSTAEIYRLDLESSRWLVQTRMPTPVDDSVALTLDDRWLLLVSGWYDTGNVDLVQVYDAQTNRWSVSSQWPGPAVFGQSGGIVGEQIVICDGVAVVGVVDGKRQFALRKGCWHGQVKVNAERSVISAIEWSELPEHPCPGTYRAAATGTTRNGARVLFAGGGTRAYNYDGIGYDGLPVAPSACVFSYDLALRAWQRHPDLEQARMDLRGLIEVADGYLLVGGLSAPRVPSAEVQLYQSEVRSKR